MGIHNVFNDVESKNLAGYEERTRVLYIIRFFLHGNRVNMILSHHKR